MSVALVFHLFGSIIWVGGMFFAHMALRPAAGIAAAATAAAAAESSSRSFSLGLGGHSGDSGSGYWIFGLWQVRPDCMCT